MKISFLAICLLFTAFASHATDFCQKLDARANVEGAQLLPRMGFSVSGKGRLYFHSAPSEQCRISKFVVPKDSLIGYQDFGVWTSVMYVHPVTHEDTMGWVKTNRLKVTGTMSAQP